MKSTHSGYIPSIDGLRAVAVSLVLLYHVKTPYFLGGYIGVDVFFVISGFLITRGIVSASQNNKFSFLNFYVRRAARLFPALFITILATLIAGFFILGPSSLSELAGSALTAALFFANIFFALDTGYFDTASHLKPLLHMWSLSVEEQFYLIWPVTILTLIWALKAKAKYAIPVIGFISLAAALYFFPKNPTFVFFMMPFRVFQFCIGAALAFWAYPSASGKGGHFGLLAILLLIGLNVWIGDSRTGVLSTALAPAVLTGIFIASARAPILETIFASKPAVWLGQRSYSVYLVHWPIIVYFGIKTGFSFSAIDQVLLIIASLVLGAVLYNIIEQPLRIHGKQALREQKIKLTGIVLSMAAALSLSAIYINQDGFPDRIPPEMRELVADSSDAWKIRLKDIRSGVCNIDVTRHTFEDWDLSVCGEPSTTRPNAFIIGDSYAGGAYMSLKRAYPDVNFLQLSVPGCRLNLPENMSDEGKYAECKKLYEQFFNELLPSREYDAVVLTSNWLPNFHSDIKGLLAKITEAQTPSVLIGQRLAFADIIPNILENSISMEQAQNSAIKKINKANMKWNTFYKERYGKEATMFLDLLDLACETECSIFTRDNKLLIWDDRHLTLEGSMVMASKIRRAYSDVLTPILKASSLASPTDAVSPRLIMHCSTAFSAPDFVRSYTLEQRSPNWGVNINNPNNNSFETWDIDIADTGRVEISGQYQEGPGGIKPIKFAGLAHRDILIAEGRRGPRDCRLVADFKGFAYTPQK